MIGAILEFCHQVQNKGHHVTLPGEKSNHFHTYADPGNYEKKVIILKNIQ